jgi:hypothetical protein
MKKLVLQIAPLLVLFFLASGFASPVNDEAIVKIDGKLIKTDSEVVFERDDTVWLEATGIKPNSKIDINVKKMGISWMKDFYDVDETGEVKGIMHIPEQRLTVTCLVSYYSKDNKFHEVKFKCKTR